MTQERILKGLLNEVEAGNFGLPISYPNLIFTPPDTNRFLRVEIIPNETRTPLMGEADLKDYVGLMQIDVFDERGNGVGWAYQQADVIADFFKYPKLINYDGLDIQFYRQPSIEQVSYEHDSIFIPITVYYMARF